jgi:hypothetical protein
MIPTEVGASLTDKIDLHCQIVNVHIFRTSNRTQTVIHSTLFNPIGQGFIWLISL